LGLNQHGPATAEPPAARLHTLADIAAYAASQGIMPRTGIEIGVLMICESLWQHGLRQRAGMAPRPDHRDRLRPLPLRRQPALRAVTDQHGSAAADHALASRAGGVQALAAKRARERFRV
jgi:hypothetical protein